MSKIVKCKICNEDIAASAKVCPKCGAKVKKPFYKKWWLWLLIVVIIFAVSSGGGSNETVNQTSDNETTKTESNQKEKEASYKPGDVIKTKKFEINVTNIETATSVGDQYLKSEPAEGGIYVIVNWEYKNISDSPISSFTCPSVKLSDKNGTKYDSDLNATTYYATEVNLDRKVLSDLNPNIKVKDALVFEISEEAYNQGGFSVLVDADKDFAIEIE